jgi:hypothetical protein
MGGFGLVASCNRLGLGLSTTWQPNVETPMPVATLAKWADVRPGVGYAGSRAR